MSTSAGIIRSIPNKDVRQVVKKACRSPRVTLERGSRHVRLFVAGELVSTIPGSPSDWRSVKNMKRELARKGITT